MTNWNYSEEVRVGRLGLPNKAKVDKLGLLSKSQDGQTRRTRQDGKTVTTQLKTGWTSEHCSVNTRWTLGLLSKRLDGQCPSCPLDTLGMLSKHKLDKLGLLSKRIDRLGLLIQRQGGQTYTTQ